MEGEGKKKQMGSCLHCHYGRSTHPAGVLQCWLNPPTWAGNGWYLPEVMRQGFCQHHRVAIWTNESPMEVSQ